MYLDKHHRIALLMHEGTCSSMGKTGLSMIRYRPEQIVAVIDYQIAGQSLTDLTGIQHHIPLVASVQDALSYAPDVLAIGIAPSGGKLPDKWFHEVELAVKAGLNIVNGLHTSMEQHPSLSSYLKPNQWIWDVRKEPAGLTVGTGQARHLTCKRVLTVGTDMSVGKMSTTLELHRACQQRGLRSQVVATGQTALMLGYDGVPLDAIRVDYASGAIEQMLLRYGSSNELVFVEGQGSLLNPASTATLPLLRGTQPTHLVLVHRAGQTHINNFPEISIPNLKVVINLYEQIAKAGGAFFSSPVVGIALNTGNLNLQDAATAIKKVEAETNLPCTDVFRFGLDKVLDRILN